MTSKKNKTIIEELHFNTIKRLMFTKSPKELATSLDLSVALVNRIIRALHKSGNALKFEYYNKPKESPTKNNTQIIGEIISIFRNDRSLTQIECKEKLLEHGVSLCINKMNRLVSESDLRPKRIHHGAKNTLTDFHKLAVRDYCVKLSSLRGKSFLFLDKCGFNLYTSTNYGYAMSNEDSILF
ncbi:hypothetical protein CDIK_3873 [Cucumispora dikerogammari]|nr:hypothetical protein CDIK_3873 [Cucumispora dikerogammari]